MLLNIRNKNKGNIFSAKLDHVEIKSRPYLCRAGVHHGGWEYGQDGTPGIQDALLQDGLVLPHPDGQGDVVGLGPAAQRVQEKDWVLVTAGFQLRMAVLTG